MPFLTPADYALLPQAVCDRADLPVLIERAETRLLDRYTEQVAGADVVRLRGYNSDASLMDAELKRRLLITIATMVDHMASAPDARVRSEQRGDRSVVYREDGIRGVYDLLDRFDQREPLVRL